MLNYVCAHLRGTVINSNVLRNGGYYKWVYSQLALLWQKSLHIQSK